MRRCLSTAAVTFLALMFLAVPGCPQLAEAPLDSVVPIDGAAADGRTYADLVAAWWQWAFLTSLDRNPLQDQTGEFAAEGQSGNVWFLAGTGGGEVTREVTIPAGKELFFPILNAIAGSPFDCAGLEACDEALLRADVDESLSGASVVQASIDGETVPDLTRFQAESPPGFFTIVVPENGLFDLPAGAHEAVVAGGFWLLLEPLSPGAHTIQFHAVIGDPDDPLFALTVTYDLTVAP